MFRSGKYNKEVYDYFVTSKHPFWSLRYVPEKLLSANLCNINNTLYAMIAEEAIGYRVC